MNDQPLPTWFWVVAVLAVLWNVMGAFAYYSDVTMSPEALVGLPQAQQDLRAAMPSWVTGLYAIAVFGGLAAAITLCLKNKLAIPLFAVSLAAVVIQMLYVSFGLNAVGLMGTSTLLFPAVTILLGALQLWFSMHAKGRGWIA